FGLPEDRARMLQQRAARRRRRHARPAAREQRDAERFLHVADAGRGGGKRKMRPFGAVGDAARLDHMAKQAEIGQIKAHRRPSFALRESRLKQMSIVPVDFNAIISSMAKYNRDSKPA